MAELKKLYTIQNKNSGVIYNQVLATESFIIKQRWAAYMLGESCPIFNFIDADHLWQIYQKNGFEIIEFDLTKA